MHLKRKLKLGLRLGKKAQASLELSLAWVCIFLLLLGSLKVFVWVNKRLIVRQEDYEASRVDAGSDVNPGKEVDESRYPGLDIFGNSDRGAW